VEQRRDPRHDVLSRRRRRRHDRLVGVGQGDDQRRNRLGQHVLVGGRIRQQDLLDAVELGRGLGGRPAVMTGDENVHVGAERLGGGQRLCGRIFQRFIVVVGEKKCRHQIAPASFLSLSSSSATVLTLTPALRTGGSLVLTTSSRGLISTP